MPPKKVPKIPASPVFDVLNSLGKTTIGKLGGAAYSEFSDMGDYIWKAPRLIESEVKDELKKLRDYFPLTGDAEADKEAVRLRQIRASLELPKLASLFPRHMAIGNFFAGFSVYETYCLMLVHEIEKASPNRLNNIEGERGVTRFLKFFDAAGLNFKSSLRAEQVNSSLQIRNSLLHASGFLNWSAKVQELKRIVAARAYLPKEIRDRNIKGESLTTCVSIEQGDLGEQLTINNTFAWITCNYLRDNFVDLCFRAEEKFEGLNSV